MPANFDFLKGIAEYKLFAAAAMEAERVLATSPALAAAGARKALELAVKWVYAADTTMEMPYKDNLQALIHEPTFRFAVDSKTWGKLPYIVKLGNLAVHTEKAVSRGDAVLALRGLFEFVQWLDYCYGAGYEEREFDEAAIPQDKAAADEAILKRKDAEIERLLAQIAAMSGALTAQKEQHKEEREFTAEDISEYQTRKRYIDVDLKLLGWTFGEDVREEVPLDGMPNNEGTGYADYVLYGRDGLPLAVVEAKRTGKDPRRGTNQAKLYADCLEKMTGRRPIMFTTNGFEYHVWDDLSGPQRRVSGVFAKADLEKLMSRRTQRKELTQVRIDDAITDRYYQKEAIRAVCGNIAAGHRKSLLVMATGTGKTRTAASLTDVLSRGGYITNVLFLADRKALVKQARDDFRTHLPTMSLCNLLNGTDDKNARIVFSTYPTMLNAIDTARSEDGKPLFTPAHFDLIIIDEAHRSIFKKYRAIFEYFDAYLVGLTATPKTDIDRNTYEFFEMEIGVPTYAYDYETAVEKDRVLVPYHNIEVRTKFLEQGITYDELSPEDKERYEEDFTDEEGEMPEFIPPPAMNEFIFNQDTVDYVLEHLMDKGLKVEGGDKLGKTIIFAANHNHAVFIEERFNKLYPQYKGQFAQVIDNKVEYAQTRITDFKVADRYPQIAISVDMLDTGIDVPEIVNLVYFKKVRSKTKFWQMLGRGTRLCKDLFGPGQDKQCFYVFDYLGNFEFFRQNPQGIEAREGESVTEGIFRKRVRLIYHLQDAAFAGEAYQAWRNELVETVVGQIQALNPELVAVRLRREYAERYKERGTFMCLTESDRRDLCEQLAPLVYMDDEDEFAKRFDNLMYGLMLAQIEALPQYGKGKRQLTDVSAKLAKRATIPQVKEKLELIKAIQEDEFWRNTDVLTLEKVRAELRELVKFTVDKGRGLVYTDLTDPILGVREGGAPYPADDFADYRLKVNRYIEKNKDSLAIHKLRNNIPLTASDYETLEHILTGELGTREDYAREFGDTPFGLLVRKIGKLEYDAAMKAFSEFINDQSLNQGQIVFVKKVVDYVVQNGYIENLAELTKAPFDRPVGFTKLFDREKQERIIKLINEIKENAIKIVS